jgi:hypothetical protein
MGGNAATMCKNFVYDAGNIARLALYLYRLQSTNQTTEIGSENAMMELIESTPVLRLIYQAVPSL